MNDLQTSSLEETPPCDVWQTRMFVFLRGVLGGTLGGAIGFFVFQWLARRGLYGMMIPGAAIGLGASLAARGRCMRLGIVCGVAAVALSLVAEWTVFPFIKDKSLAYFLAHVHQLRPMTLIMIGVGAVFAYWLGQGR
jgi:hypothetical protein